MNKRPFEAVLVCESVVTNYKPQPLRVYDGVYPGTLVPAPAEPESYTATFNQGKVSITTAKPIQVGKTYRVVVEEQSE